MRDIFGANHGVLPFSVKKAVIKHHFRGYGRNETARKMKRYRPSFSPTNVKNIISEFVQIVEKDGLEKAAEVYGVSVEVEGLFEIAEILRKNKLDISDAVDGASIAKKMKDLGVEEEKFEPFVTTLYARTKKEGGNPSKMIAQVKTLERLEASQNKSFEEVQKEWDDINKRLPEKRRQLDAIQNAITSLEEKQGTLFQKYLNDENRLKHFEVIKNQLKTLGLSMDVLDQIQNFLISIKKLKYDAETAITKLNAVDNLEGKKVELNREIRELETKTNSSKSKLDGIQNLINEKQTLYNELVKLEEMGLSIEQIGLLRNTIVRISANHGKSVKDALAHFQNDMKNYDVMLGLGPEVDRLNRLKNTLNAEIEEAKKDKEEKQRRANKEFEEVNGRIALKKGEIESYSKLQSAGIDDATLLRWGRIIQNSKLSAEVIESELNENSSLKQSFESLRRETKTLETLKAVLTSSTQQLEQTKAELESAITAIKVSALKNMETDVKAKLALIQQDVARTLSNAREGIESTSKEALKSSTEFTTTLRDTLQAVEPQIRNVGMALEAGTKIGKYETILPLLEMIENGVVEEVPAITSILQALKGFRKCTLKNPKIVDQTTIQQVDGLIASLTQRLECVEL